MPIVTMLQDTVGCDDGIREKNYEKGSTYELSYPLAKCFLDLQVAIFADEVTDTSAIGEKAIANTPKNKALKPSSKK